MDRNEALDAEGTDVELAAAAESFVAMLDVERVEGMTSSRYGEAGDSRFVILRQRFNLAEAGVISISRGGIPTLGGVLFFGAAAIILIPLGMVYFVRARRQPPPPQAPLPPGLPR